METLWLTPALVCYALSAIGFAADVNSRSTRWLGYSVILLGAGAGFHSLDLIGRGLQAGNVPVANFPQSLSFLAWITALASIVLIVRLRTPMIGVFVAP